jgi:hypothetical protein
LGASGEATQPEGEHHPTGKAAISERGSQSGLRSGFQPIWPNGLTEVARGDFVARRPKSPNAAQPARTVQIKRSPRSTSPALTRQRKYKELHFAFTRFTLAFLRVFTMG